MRVKLHPMARAELHDARNWYLGRSAVSATAFSSTIDNAIWRISYSPHSFPRAEYGTRKLILQRFPFSIFYRIREFEIEVVAVAHQKRRPGYWSDRTESRRGDTK